jgi:hypothetical protein
MDPDNGSAWLQVAREATSRKDAAAVDNAMYRFANAKTIRDDTSSIYALAQSAVPSSAGEFERAQLHEFANQAAMPSPLSGQMFTRYCAEAALQDPSRAQTCDGLARQLIDKGSSLQERGIGITLAERLKWPAEAVAALREENDALRGALADEAADAEPESCRAVEKARTPLLQAARTGQVAAARLALAASEKSPAALAGTMREERAAARQAAEARMSATAASAPAPASRESRAGSGVAP